MGKIKDGFMLSTGAWFARIIRTIIILIIIIIIFAVSYAINENKKEKDNKQSIKYYEKIKVI